LVTPTPDARQTRGLVFAATLCAVVVLASQLAGKAARDAIFLQRFAVTNLPLLLAVSSALSIGFTILFAHRLRRGIPVRVVQLANVISAMLMLVEWQLLPYFPRPVATIVFMHQTLLGPILVSGFWSIVSECFDPHTARRVLGTIGTGATVGAVVGAVIAERVAAMFGTEMLLPTIAALELLATWRLTRVGRGCPIPTKEDAPVLRDAIRNITKVSLLRRLAIVTVIVTISAALLDYVFKATATGVVEEPDDLARLFAMFHGVVGILTALLQWSLGKWALQHLGLARTLASLPGAVIAFGIAAIIAPGIGTYVALRGAENVLRNSLYREAYEVFYTPLLAAERRATKTIIDVGVERFGDVLGGLAVLAIIAFSPFATTTLLVAAISLSAIGMIVALKAQHSYVEALERSLLAHAIDFENEEPRDRTTRATLELVRSGAFRAQPEVAKPSRWPRLRARQKAAKPSVHNATHLLTELASNDPKRIRPALEEAPLSPSGVAFAITLLDQPNVAEAAMRAIARVATSCIGQLTDAVRDPQLSPAIRAQLPTVIVAAASDRARAEIVRAGLISGLSDPELDVRCAVAEGLARLREVHPEIEIVDEMVFAGVRRELAGAATTPQAIKHLATLLALALPSEPIQMAFLGLRSEEPTLRGVALEYLENVLPTDIREQMWQVLAIEVPEAPTTAKRPLEDVLAELLRSRRDQAMLHTTQVDLPVVRGTPR
jgi:AAA family ATP:ADP antiporter